MEMQDYFQTISQARNGELVVMSIGMTQRGWYFYTGGDDLSYYMGGAMGYGSSVGIGLAMTCPDQKVWILDSDGGLAMNAGGLLTEASVEPENAIHFVLDNGCYGTLSNDALVNNGRGDYATMARGAGIRNVFVANTAAELRDAIDTCRRNAAFGFIVAKVSPEPKEKTGFESPLNFECEGPEMKYRFGRAIERVTGRRVFGPQGY